MNVNVRHTTRLAYTTEVVEGITEARLGPFTDDDQVWQRFELRASPYAAVQRFSDGFGNQAHLVTLARAHTVLEITTNSVVQTLLADPFKPPTQPPSPLTAAQRADYLWPSPQVPRLDQLEAIAESFRPAEPEHAFGAVQGLMGWVYQNFGYEPEVTTVSTTVPEVLADRRGVCQDFAHVLIGLCRSLAIPARYVSGYIATHAAQRQSQTLGGMSQSQSLPRAGDPGRGAQASHAWVEAFTPTHGWRGFDPTNNLLASQQHIKMAVGRDYRDVAPTRGTFHGTADERLSVSVEAIVA